ncbi:conserved hypothetical protein [Desulfamplus magnetovallimortis]|uniref:YicC family protein n=1 Tax=Desulfamplus magnetovallimortis TaxID=1246637 RepID=A0A1W1HCD9_9BACT|nr:YicC/YloC family endoribonuclease [Desulfamplus magnetovallimortis]SLM30119.1 conserved hypothetical protein [Desulfamplus magnetovallimortis]
MIKSMTAYSAASHEDGDIQCDVEIRSYNSRHLDIALYLPRAFSRFEDSIKKIVSNRLSRGRIETRIEIRDQSLDAVQFTVDIPRAEAYYNALLELKEKFGFGSDITIEQLLEGRDMIKASEKEQNDELIQATISKALDKALDGLEAMRSSEGSNLADDLLQRLDSIENIISLVEKDAESLPAFYRERLMERISVLTSGIDGLDPVRLSQEAAFLADKSDISEEIVRARSHIALFRETIASSEPGGRKLNFLLQEFNREFNTMGSKSGRAELSHMIVSLKSELEKIREQIQNIE